MEAIHSSSTCMDTKTSALKNNCTSIYKGLILHALCRRKIGTDKEYGYALTQYRRPSLTSHCTREHQVCSVDVHVYRNIVTSYNQIRDGSSSVQTCLFIPYC